MKDLHPRDADEPGGKWRRLWAQRRLFEAAGLTEPDPVAGDRPRKYVVGMYA
jgi:hypothetical protein